MVTGVTSWERRGSHRRGDGTYQRNETYGTDRRSRGEERVDIGSEGSTRRGREEPEEVGTVAEKKIQPKDPASAKAKAETKGSVERVNKKAARVTKRVTRFTKRVV